MNHQQTSSVKSKGAISWFIKNPVAANLLMIMIIITGFFFAQNISKRLTPEFKVSAIKVSVPYPGATPSEIEKGVVLKIEEAIQSKNISGIEKMRSASRDSLGEVNVEVSDGFDIDTMANEIKLAIDGIHSFPDAAEKPVIEKQIQTIPAVNIQIYGPALDEATAKAMANQVKDDLLAMPEISRVVIYGDRQSEIAVEISESQLRKYGLTLRAVANAINAASVDLPAGAIKSEKGNLLLRAKGRAYTEEEFKKIPIHTSTDGQRLLLGDIASITNTFEETLNSNSFDGQYSAGIGVFAVGNEDVLAIGNHAKQYVQDRQSQLPNGIKMTHWGDTVIYLEGRLALMYENLAIGALLVLIVLSIFMNLSIAFWVMIGIPVCFLGALALLPFVGVSLNLISLFGFILVLGIVVDDAIIIGESAHSFIRAENSYSVDTITRGVHRVSTPAIFGVLTTICAFLPTIFITGKWSNFPAACGFVVIFCLIFSLIESKLILPAHIAHAGAFSKLLNFKWQSDFQKRVNERLEIFINTNYQPFLRKVLVNRYITISVFLSMLLLIIALIQGGWVRYVLAPEVPSDYIRASLTMPQGTSDETVKKAAQQIEQGILSVEKQYLEETGESISFLKHRFSYNIGSSNRTTLELVPNELRSINTKEILQRWKAEVGTIIGAKNISFTDAQDEDVGIASDIAYRLSSNDENDLYDVAKDMKKHVLSYDGVTSVDDGVPDSIDEIQFNITPSGEALGLSLASVAAQVREAFYGAEAQRLQLQNDEVKVKVRYPQEERKTISNLHELYVRTADGRGAPITSVVDITVEPTLVERVRVNGKRALTVAAKVDKGYAEPKKITDAITQQYFPKIKQQHPDITIEEAGGTKDDAQMEEQLMKGFLLALLGIYALLAIPLGSYTQPLIIMSVIPFGLIGAVIGHIIMGLAVSMMSIFGIIALAGVVVNDSLILVDFINDARSKGEDLFDAVISSGGQRFRAILLTSLTTFFGILPILLETSIQAQFVIPMATSLGFGIIFATVITLIFIPCLYVLLDDFSKLKKNILKANTARTMIDI